MTPQTQQPGAPAGFQPLQRAERRSRGPARRTPRVHLYAQCWNDEFMLPYFFRHYDSFVDRYIIFDDGSTDRSQAILADHPKVELRRFVWSDPDSFAASEQALSNRCWKESRDEADWVIVTDVDEHLFHPAMPQYLASCADAGVTVVPALGFQMICQALPDEAALLHQAAVRGAPWHDMMKASIFNPREIEEINFEPGRHRAGPVGNLRAPERDEVLLLHYKYLGQQRTYARQRELLRRLGTRDRTTGWGRQYAWSRDELLRDWARFSDRTVNVFKVRPEAYPLRRWWHSRMEIVPVTLPPVGAPAIAGETDGRLAAAKTAEVPIYFRFDPMAEPGDEFTLWYRPAASASPGAGEVVFVRLRWFDSEGRVLVWQDEPRGLDLTAGDDWQPLAVTPPVWPKNCAWLRFEVVTAADRYQTVCAGFVFNDRLRPGGNMPRGAGACALALTSPPPGFTMPDDICVTADSDARRAGAGSHSEVSAEGERQAPLRLPIDRVEDAKILFFVDWPCFGKRLATVQLPDGLPGDYSLLLPEARAGARVLGYTPGRGVFSLPETVPSGSARYAK
jgi:hypothetical protein